MYSRHSPLLTCIFWLCVYSASGICLAFQFWLQPGVTEVAVGVWSSEKKNWNEGKIAKRHLNNWVKNSQWRTRTDTFQELLWWEKNCPQCTVRSSESSCWSLLPCSWVARSKGKTPHVQLHQAQQFFPSVNPFSSFCRFQFFFFLFFVWYSTAS